MRERELVLMSPEGTAYSWGNSVGRALSVYPIRDGWYFKVYYYSVEKESE